MKDNSVVNVDNILLNIKLKSKKEVINKLSELLLASGVVLDKKRFTEDLYERENRGFTFGGNYLAIPHASSNCVIQPQIAIVRTADAFEWDENGNLVKLVIMFAIPEKTERKKELELLKKIAFSLGDVELVEKLLKVSTEEELMELIYSYPDDQ